MSLFRRVWIKVHFPLEGPVIYHFEIFIEIICRCSSVTYNRKQKSIICKQLCIGSEAFFKIININQKQQKTKDGTLRYSSIDIFSCRDLFIKDYTLFSFLENPPIGLVNSPILHFELVC